MIIFTYNLPYSEDWFVILIILHAFIGSHLHAGNI